jgi:hypothetical protein
MMWNNTPCHHTIFKILFLDHGITDYIFLSWHDVTKLHVMKNFNFFFKKLSKTNFDTICHDVQMFINYIYTIYVYACIYQGLNPRLHGSTPRS